MRRMSSTIVTIGLLAALSTACSEGEERADWSRICVDREQVRVEDSNCPDDDLDHGRFFHPVWVASGHRSPPVGEKPIAGSFTGTKPSAGTIGRPPASGGFGTTRGSTAG